MTPAMKEAPGHPPTRAALLSLVGIAVVTVAWWCLALWPSADVPPEWLLRTRQVCFNTGPSGLPDGSGWMLLIGQPVGMLAILMAVAGNGVTEVLQQARTTRLGRGALALSAIGLLVGASLAVARVRAAVPDAEWLDATSTPIPSTYPRLDTPLPTFALVDQHGDEVTKADLVGEPAIITFAFGHCETICPMVVHNSIRARASFPVTERPSIIVVTLDPWRDTPNRLPALADQFMLEEGDRVLSGTVDDVNRFLDELNVSRERDLKTGDIIHPSLVYLVDREGQLAYGATGHATLIEELLGRL